MQIIINWSYKIFIFIHKKFLQILGGSTVGVRAIVINDKKQVLLVKHTYNRDWYLPGGGVKKNETAIAAIIRELYEETGVTVINQPQLIDIYFHQMFGVNDYPILYLVKEFTQTVVFSAEIATIAWFDFHNLPSDISPATRQRLNEYFLNAPRSNFWK